MNANIFFKTFHVKTFNVTGFVYLNEEVIQLLNISKPLVRQGNVCPNSIVWYYQGPIESSAEFMNKCYSSDRPVPYIVHNPHAA